MTNPSSLLSWPVLTFLLLAGAAGRARGQRGDVPPDQGGTSFPQEASPCSCESSVVVGVIVTVAVLLTLAAFWWCFQERRRRHLGKVPSSSIFLFISSSSICLSIPSSSIFPSIPSLFVCLSIFLFK